MHYRIASYGCFVVCVLEQLMTVLNEIKMHLVQRVRGQRSGERSTGEGSTLSSTLQSLMKTHLSMFDCFTCIRSKGECGIQNY